MSTPATAEPSTVKGDTHGTPDTVPGFLKDIGKDLRELPDIIAKSEERVFKASVALENKRAVREAIRVRMGATVADEKGTDGKAKFSNAEKRDAEVLGRLASDGEYQTADKAVHAAEQEFSTAKIELNRTSNKFSSSRHLSDLFAGYFQRRA